MSISQLPFEPGMTQDIIRDGWLRLRQVNLDEGVACTRRKVTEEITVVWALSVLVVPALILLQDSARDREGHFGEHLLLVSRFRFLLLLNGFLKVNLLLVLENTEAKRVQEEVVSVHSLVEIEARFFCFEDDRILVLAFGLLDAFDSVQLLDWHESWSVTIVADFKRL